MFAMQNIVFNVMKVPHFVRIICTLHSVPQVIDILVTKLNHNRGVLTDNSEGCYFMVSGISVVAASINCH